MKREQSDLERAVLYALRCGCFFPVKLPKGKRLTIKNLIKWGAMRNLHRAIAGLPKGV